MKVEILASTVMRSDVLSTAYDYDQYGDDWEITEADALGEAAGRMCYQSWGRKNPATATNEGYLANIVRQGHFSVLEHASVTFLVREVSRSLLTELTRHRHLSPSVVSQRYVDYSYTEPVLPPAVESAGNSYAEDVVRQQYRDAVQAYELLVQDLTERGLPRKAAREAARCVLPNAAPVDMIVTGNLRAWRDVLAKRWHVASDAEIRAFASAILGELRSVAPNSFADVPEAPYGSEA